MQLPYNLITNTYTAPPVYLCEVDKTRICELNTIELSGTFKFNSYSEIEFEVPRIVTNTNAGENEIYSFYDKIEALRLIHMPGFGYFELQDPEETSDGIETTKSVNAFSLEYTLSHKYLVNFIINNPEIAGNIGGGEPNSEEVDPTVIFYNPNDPSHSLLHLILVKARGWNIGHVDESLAQQTRSFEIDRESIYDFLMNDVAETFKCYFVFDTENNLVHAYTESNSVKFTGDGETTSFIVVPAFTTLGTVTIGGQPTMDYTYDVSTGQITFNSIPTAGLTIEVTDGSQVKWQTDVYVSFENLASKMSVSYEADNIKTCISVKGDDDLDIRDVNLGSDYIIDLSYYHTRDWMGDELYESYNEYVKLINQQTPIFTELLQEYNELQEEYNELYNRMTTDTSDDQVINLTKTKLDYFHRMLRVYCESGDIDGTFPNSTLDITDRLTEDFAFLGDGVISKYLSDLRGSSSLAVAETVTLKILDAIWNEFGITMLQIYIDSYTNNQQTHLMSGWSASASEHYYMYWANYMMLISCQAEYQQRKQEADQKQAEMHALHAEMDKITELISMENNFTEKELIKLSSFIREDEFSDTSFVITEVDTLEDIFKTKQDLLQCGRVEAARLCGPTLAFDCKLANIYAIPSFAPIIHQFQLGNFINVGLRPGYIRQVRLMEVDINFKDLSDFGCSFGDLIATRSQADIHADLLKQSASAGKSVARNGASWTRGANLATATSNQIQNGLIDEQTSIRSTSPTQASEWNQNGIYLRKYAEGSTTEFDPKQAMFKNNQLFFTEDNWKTTSVGIGEIEHNGKVLYGIKSNIVLAGYIEGSDVVGGTIQIGDRGDGSYNFEVDKNGLVTFNGEKLSENLSTTSIELNSLKNAFDQITVDYIVECNTVKDTIWTYEKWYSGKSVCWGRQTYDDATFKTLSDSSLAIYSTETSIEYPDGLFIAPPIEQVTGRCSKSIVWLCNSGDTNTKNKTATYDFIAPTTPTDSQTAYIDFYVVGKWKE